MLIDTKLYVNLNREAARLLVAATLMLLLPVLAIPSVARAGTAAEEAVLLQDQVNKLAGELTKKYLWLRTKCPGIVERTMPGAKYDRQYLDLCEEIVRDLKAFSENAAGIYRGSRERVGYASSLIKEDEAAARIRAARARLEAAGAEAACPVKDVTLEQYVACADQNAPAPAKNP